MGSAFDFNASLCFADAVYNPAIRSQVSALLKQASTPDNDKQFQAFLDANNYKTSPAAVRAAFEALKDQRPKITPDAVRFAATFLTNSTLRTDWINAARATASGLPSQSKTAVKPGDPDPALAPMNQVLVEYGFKDLSAEQAVAAQANLMNDPMTVWAGVYDTVITPRVSGKSVPAESPKLTVSSDFVKLAGMGLIGAAFNDDDLTLVWVENPPSTAASNHTTGQLVFSTRADGSKHFAGRLTHVQQGRNDTDWDLGDFDFVGNAPAPVSPPAAIPPSDGGGGSSTLTDALAIAGLVVGVLGTIAGAIGTYYGYRSWRQAVDAAPPNNNNPPNDPPNNPPNDPPNDPNRQDPDSDLDDPLSQSDSVASRRVSDASIISDDVVRQIDPPLGSDVVSRVAPGPVVELVDMINPLPGATFSVSQIDSQASAAADDLDLSDDEFDPEPEPAPEPEPVDV